MNTIEYGYTHAGRFHADDVLSTVLLRTVFPKIIINRIAEVDEEHLKPNSIVYDIGLGEYDHHQENKRINDRGNPYSAFGLLFETYGRNYLKLKGFKKIDKAFIEFRNKFVEMINVIDNTGYRNSYDFKETELIKSFNPRWFEAKDKNLDFDTAFYKACQFAEMIMDNWCREIYSLVESFTAEKETFDQAVNYMDQGILLLEELIDWKNHIKQSIFEPMIYIVIQKSMRGGYDIYAKDKKKVRINDNQYVTYVSESGCMARAKTKAFAFLAAKSFLEQ